VSRFFPNVDDADENGLLAIGGQLTPAWLLDAYSSGIFPWPFEDYRRAKRYLLGWFAPDPRCIFDFDTFHVSRRMRQTCRNGKFRIAVDTDFEGVMRGCAEGTGRQGGTWITPQMMTVYCQLYKLGYAHSVETYVGNELAGGIYGVAVKGLFAAESMFYRHRDASKAALIALMEHLQRQGFQLVDIQMKTEHTARFGAVEISRSEYTQRLQKALKADAVF
jgi:leucyl/phenylalanyl-tRNA--protein transferase